MRLRRGRGSSSPGDRVVALVQSCELSRDATVHSPSANRSARSRSPRDDRHQSGRGPPVAYPTQAQPGPPGIVSSLVRPGTALMRRACRGPCEHSRAPRYRLPLSRSAVVRQRQVADSRPGTPPASRIAMARERAWPEVYGRGNRGSRLSVLALPKRTPSGAEVAAAQYPARVLVGRGRGRSP